MVEEFEAVLARYEARAAQEDARWQAEAPDALFSARDEFLLHVGREAADFLLALAVAAGAVRIVELGTSYGYSTLFLAEAARRTGGTVTTYELSPDKQRHARGQIEDAGLGAYVEWRSGDAVSLLETQPDGVDFVLLDLWKELYVPCLEQLYPKLADHALIAADNMLFPEMVRDDADRYRAAVIAKPGIQSMLLRVGSGIELSSFTRASA